MAFPVKSHYDFNRYQLLNAVLHKSTTAPATPVAGSVWFDDNTGVKVAKFYNGTIWKSMVDTPQNIYSIVKTGTSNAPATSTADQLLFTGDSAISIDIEKVTDTAEIAFTFVPANVLHNDLGGLTLGDPHSQYLSLTVVRTITAIHTFQPGSASSAPFNVGTNGTAVVTRLNADKVDGFDATSTWSAAIHIPATDGAGKLDKRVLTEQLALADLSDVASTTGTGTVAVLATNPTLVGATLTSTIAMGNNKITGLGTPTVDTDAATMGFVLAEGAGPQAQGPGSRRYHGEHCEPLGRHPAGCG
jgi:hypothetical protein